MLFEVRKMGNFWKIWKMNEKIFIDKYFCSKQKAIIYGEKTMIYHGKPLILKKSVFKKKV